MTATWARIKAMLEERGDMVRGVTTKVRATACGTCHAPTLTALAAGPPSWIVVADPAPLAALGEALAVVTGRATYSLWSAGDRYELDHRTSFHIAGTPAGTARRFDVVAEHRCGSPPLPTTDTVHQPAARQESARCPF